MTADRHTAATQTLQLERRRYERSADTQTHPAVYALFRGDALTDRQRHERASMETMLRAGRLAPLPECFTGEPA